MAKETEPFELSAMVKQAMKKPTEASIAISISLRRLFRPCLRVGLNLARGGKAMRRRTSTPAHEFIKQLSQAKDFEQMMRIQMEFMQSQANAFGEQMKSFAETYTKAAAGGAKMPFKSSLD